MNYTVIIKEISQRRLTYHDFDLLFDAIKMVSKSFIHGEDTTMYTTADDVEHSELILTGTIPDVIIDSKDYIESIVKTGITNFMWTKVKLNITKDVAPPFIRTVKPDIADIHLEYTIYMCMNKEDVIKW